VKEKVENQILKCEAEKLQIDKQETLFEEIKKKSKIEKMINLR
jgi:hypothetical protein